MAGVIQSTIDELIERTNADAITISVASELNLFKIIGITGEFGRTFDRNGGVENSIALGGGLGIGSGQEVGLTTWYYIPRIVNYLDGDDHVFLPSDSIIAADIAGGLSIEGGVTIGLGFELHLTKSGYFGVSLVGDVSEIVDILRFGWSSDRILDIVNNRIGLGDLDRDITRNALYETFAPEIETGIGVYAKYGSNAVGNFVADLFLPPSNPDSANVHISDGSNSTVDAGGGNDIIYDYGGNNTTIIGGSGRDFIFSTSYSSHIYGDRRIAFGIEGVKVGSCE